MSVPLAVVAVSSANGLLAEPVLTLAVVEAAVSLFVRSGSRGGGRRGGGDGVGLRACHGNVELIPSHEAICVVEATSSTPATGVCTGVLSELLMSVITILEGC